MITYILNHFRQLFCRHDYESPTPIQFGSWYRHQMPHPVWPEVFIPCERQDFISVCRCKKCDKRKMVEGYNLRDPLNVPPLTDQTAETIDRIKHAVFPKHEPPTFTD